MPFSRSGIFDDKSLTIVGMQTHLRRSLGWAFLLTTASALLLPWVVFAGYVQTHILPVYRTGAGKIVLDIEIQNEGDATAHNVRTFVFLSGRVDERGNLGDNTPGGTISVKSRFEDPTLKPGLYTAVIRVNFEEQGGAPHRAFEFVKIPFGQVDGLESSLSVELEGPVINTRALWGSGSAIRVSLKNGHKKSIRPLVSFYFPDGVSSTEPEKSFELQSGEEKHGKIPLTVHAGSVSAIPFHAVVTYEMEGTHYSTLANGKIRLEARPFLFKAFAVAGVMVLIILVGRTVYVSGKGRKSA
ncbi:MAG: hypothetical protein C4576_13170 [Desulfobacteraceae bacterium]|nr:MAG: hypothetical protein C4576_13170 [Desulfobacteraceae bacterium]